MSHLTPEGLRSLLFLRPLLGRLHRAPVVAVRPPRPGGLAALLLGWGTPWCTGPVGRVAGARARDRCHCVPLAAGGVWRVVPPPSVQADGRPRVPLAVCPWRAVPPVAGRPPTLGRRWRMSWTLCLLPGGGPCEALPVALAWLASKWWGCAPVRCGASWTGVGYRW